MIRPDSAAWSAAKAEGDSAELAVASWFRSLGFETFKTLGQASFDLLLTCRVEVKRDLRAAETGNVAVEVEYRGRSSGIHDSQATYWAFVLDDEALVIKTRTLRDLISRSEFPERYCGDGNQSLVRLVPVDTLRKAKDVRVVRLMTAKSPRRAKRAV